MKFDEVILFFVELEVIVFAIASFVASIPDIKDLINRKKAEKVIANHEGLKQGLVKCNDFRTSKNVFLTLNKISILKEEIDFLNEEKKYTFKNLPKLEKELKEKLNKLDEAQEIYNDMEMQYNLYREELKIEVEKLDKTEKELFMNEFGTWLEFKL